MSVTREKDEESYKNFHKDQATDDVPENLFSFKQIVNWKIWYRF